MTAYGLSPRFLDKIVETQKKGVTGHIEWFPATLALREGFGLVFVRHDLRGRSLGRSCDNNRERMGGTFNYCCQGKNTVEAENWFEGWKRSSECAPPTLLHPVKGDACGRFSANGFGRGCWARVSGGSGDPKGKAPYHDVFEAGKFNPQSAPFYRALSGSELARTLN